ncbi:MAG: branched-chain amino acid ABC transporter permease [Alphaproteobacteria bacterium]|nr:branched-chain amino acid ABC transporter permease [Alphaproteobacteria bacterium]
MALAGLAFGVAAFLPLLDTGYWLSVGVSIATYTVLATAWALFSGPTHYISLATAAFYGIGMYTVGIGVGVLPFPILLVIAAFLGAALAAVVGLATLRLSGVYFVIFTLGLAEFIRQIMTWVQTTRGTSSGLYVLTDINESMIYWQLLVLAAIVYLIGWRIARSRLGFALRIIGNDEVVAAHCGIGTARAKILMFVVSGTLAAIVGAIMAPRLSYIEPTLAFSPMLSFLVVIMALLGGAHRLWGPLVGVIPLTLMWDAISAQFPNQSTLLLGVAFLSIVYLIPNGIVGWFERIAQAWKRGNG